MTTPRLCARPQVASSSADIAPAYVSPVAYQSYFCQQLALEAQAVSTRAATLSGVQDSQRTKDQWTTAAAVVIFWPAAFLVQGDKQNAAELAQMKGQMVAIEQASIAKKCNIQFQGKMTQGGSGSSGALRRAGRVHLCADRPQSRYQSIVWQSRPPAHFGFEYTAYCWRRFIQQLLSCAATLRAPLRSQHRGTMINGATSALIDHV